MKYSWAGVVASNDVIEAVTRFVEAGVVTTRDGQSKGLHISNHASDVYALNQVHLIAELCPDMVMRIEEAASYESWCVTARGHKQWNFSEAV